jgi:hypothetical protein
MEVSDQLHVPTVYLQAKIPPPITQQTRAWVGPRYSLDTEKEKEKNDANTLHTFPTYLINHSHLLSNASIDD